MAIRDGYVELDEREEEREGRETRSLTHGGGPIQIFGPGRFEKMSKDAVGYMTSVDVI